MATQQRSIPSSPAPREALRAVVMASTAAIIPALALAAGASGYEPTTELPVGGLSFAANSTVTIEREDVIIGIDKVRLTYVLRNLTPRAVTIPMAFPLPDIDTLELDGAAIAMPAYDNQNPTNFLGFWTMIDGKPVDPSVNTRALVLGVADVTRSLTDSNLPLYPFAPEMADRISQLTPETRADFAARGILNAMVDPPAPAWTLRTGFHWPVDLAADKSVTVQHGYKPILGSDVWTAELAPDLTARFCIPPEMTARLDAKQASGDAPIVYWMSYEPGPKAHMKGRSTQFNLTLEKPSEQGFTASCFKGLKATSSTALEWSAADHLQSDELHVLFIE